MACGRTGLGDDRSGWVLALTEELGVKFNAVYEGPAGDWFSDIAETGDGLAVLGNTHVTTRWANFPWTAGSWTVPLLLKLPWEGILRFHPDTGMHSLFLQPRVYHSSASPLFQTLSGSGLLTFSNRQSPAPLVATDLPWISAGALPAPVPQASYVTLPIEAVDPGEIQTYDDWAAYHYLSGNDALPTADPDGDGRKNLFESYFGSDPRLAETDSPLTIRLGESNGVPVVILEHVRATYGANLGVLWQVSQDLSNWAPFQGGSTTTVEVDLWRERVQIIAPRDAATGFFRLLAPGL